MTRTTGVVLAGGGSRRMGADKRGLRLLPESPTFLERTVAVARLAADRVAVVGDAGGPPAGVEKIADRWPRAGPLAGLLSAFEAYPEERLVVLACDYPMLQLSVVRSILGALGAGEAAVAVGEDGRRHPLVGVYDVARCTAAARATLDEGRRSMHELLGRLDLVEVRVGGVVGADVARLSLGNVNSPDDLVQLRDECRRLDREGT